MQLNVLFVMRIAESGEKPPLIQRARWRLNNAYAG